MTGRTVFWLVTMVGMIVVISLRTRSTIVISTRMEQWKRAFRDQMITEEGVDNA